MKKETIFKVGDRPKWTPELIKQLPHGTVLECAYNSANKKEWEGRHVIFECNAYVEPYSNMPFYLIFEGKYAKIISPPETKSIKEKLKGTCVLNEKEGMGAEIVKLYMAAGVGNIGIDPMLNTYIGEHDGLLWWSKDTRNFTSVLTLDQLRAIVRGEKQTVQEYEKQLEEKFVAESVEFKEGEMVEGRMNDWKEGLWTHASITYTGWKTKQGKFACEIYNGKVVAYDEIRKIDSDADLKKIADEFIKNAIKHNPYEGVASYIATDNVKSMLIEAMKRVKK